MINNIKKKMQKQRNDTIYLYIIYVRMQKKKCSKFKIYKHNLTLKE